MPVISVVSQRMPMIAFGTQGRRLLPHCLEGVRARPLAEVRIERDVATTPQAPGRLAFCGPALYKPAFAR
jgi:hypothetical protein